MNNIYIAGALLLVLLGIGYYLYIYSQPPAVDVPELPEAKPEYVNMEVPSDIVAEINIEEIEVPEVTVPDIPLPEDI